MKNNKVLLLEDDRTMLPLLSRVLSLEGFQALYPTEFQKLLIVEMIIKEKPAAIFMDVHLEEIDGIEFMGEIRAADILGSTKVMMTSGLEMRRECLSSGADEFLMKPFVPSEMIDWLKTIIGSEES
jgi:two-component system response regulator AdeR